MFRPSFILTTYLCNSVQLIDYILIAKSKCIFMILLKLTLNIDIISSAQGWVLPSPSCLGISSLGPPPEG